MKVIGAGRVKFVLAAMVMLCVPAVQLFAQEGPNRRIARIVYDGDLVNLLANIAEPYNVTIGFEAAGRRPTANIKFELTEATLEDVLNAIVASAPAYQWQREGGSVDVFPKAASCPLLNTVVHSFQYNGSDWTQASHTLTDLPEVQSQMLSLALRRREVANLSPAKDAKQFSISLTDVSVRKGLHEITRNSGNRFWIFQQSSAGDHSFSISNSIQW